MPRPGIEPGSGGRLRPGSSPWLALIISPCNIPGRRLPQKCPGFQGRFWQSRPRAYTQTATSAGVWALSLATYTPGSPAAAAGYAGIGLSTQLNEYWLPPMLGIPVNETPVSPVNNRPLTHSATFTVAALCRTGICVTAPPVGACVRIFIVSPPIKRPSPSGA